MDVIGLWMQKWNLPVEPRTYVVEKKTWFLKKKTTNCQALGSLGSGSFLIVS